MKVTKEMIKAGNQMASDLTDATIIKNFDGIGGGLSFVQWKDKEIKNRDLILKHLNNEIDSVTAIYAAMRREVRHEVR